MDIYERRDARLRDAWKVAATDEFGNPVHDQVLPDRANVRVPLVLMDAELKATQDARLAERDRVRAELDAKLFAGSTGRGHLNTDTLSLPVGQRSAQLSDAERAQRERPYDAYASAISNAWRNPPSGG